MIPTRLDSRIFLFSLFLLDLFCKVVSESCGRDIFCESPYVCCMNKQACCYDHENNGYTRGFKLHVWNMWYFWLVIIFIMMSCFGGCGYYRRRRLAATLQRSVPMPPTTRSACASRGRHQQSHPPQMDFYAYTGPGVHASPDTQLPPPYTEVMQQPNMYPVNKVDLPPYPGPPGNKDSSALEEANPPPYCEVASIASPQDQTRDSAASREYVSVPLETPQSQSQQQSNGEHTGQPPQPASLS